MRRRGLSAEPAAWCRKSDGVLVKHYRSCDVCALHVSHMATTDRKSLMEKAMSVCSALGALYFLKKKKTKQIPSQRNTGIRDVTPTCICSIRPLLTRWTVRITLYKRK